MGKKRVITKTKEELFKERDKIETAMKKEIKVKTPQRMREGRIYVYSSYNNTILSLSDSEGNILYWTSAGRVGFKGAKKGTPFAASKVAEALTHAAEKLKINRVKIFVKGTGSGRDSAVRSLAARGFHILSIKDVTPVPHNGCRPKKPRRV